MSNDSSSPSDFRENTRAPVQAPATLQLDAFSEPLSGLTANVSLGGMFVQMDDQPPVGSIVKYKVELGTPPAAVHGTAEVVWMRTAADGPQRPAGVGLQFRLVEGAGGSILKTIVSKALEELGPEPPPPPKRKPRPPQPLPRPRPSELPDRSGGKKPGPKKQKKETKKGAGKPAAGDEKQILGMPAERFKLIVLVILGAILLLSFLL